MANATTDGRGGLRPGKIILIFVLGTTLFLAGFLYKTMKDAGELKTLEPHSDLSCTTVEGVLSSEDITIDPQTGTAFISSGVRGIGIDKDRTENGSVVAYNLNDENPELINLTSDFKEDFHPHGLGFYSGKDGGPSLFVVNHRQDGDFVEIFDFDGSKLTHRKSVSHDLMHNPNDVIPVGPDSFYVTNDHGARTFNGQILEDFLQLPNASVLYFDGNEFHVAAEDLHYANGINLSADGRIVFVTETIGGQVIAFDRDVDSGKLTVRATIDLDTGVDNVEIAGDGSLWIGAHPKLLTFAKHAKDQSLLSPSQVIRLELNENGFSQKEIYLEDGSTLSGSSVAATYKNKVLIGGVFAPRFLVCERKTQEK